jgi:SAM-dependent methyltransferase
MPDYQAIYNDIVSKNANYNLAENSPGLRNVTESTSQLSGLFGRSLDIGCGVGFVVQHLLGPTFNLRPFGIDVSDQSITKAKTRLAGLQGLDDRILVSSCLELPFEDNFFSLVTCFDVLEHLDEADIDKALSEINRVVRPGGTFFGSVSCREAGSVDINGDNLHRTVKSPDWWISKTNPDRAVYDGHRQQFSIWKQRSLHGDALFGTSNNQASNDQASNDQATANSQSSEIVPGHPAESKELYQKIYDENPWYGDASEGRCPGVRLLPIYKDWLIGPVIDLGCGRGQTVEHLRKMGLQAEGIDQIEKHPEMMVGDITKPIEKMNRFKSAVCVDCIEHLYDHQVEGLFTNMRQVKRQAFSIHNGESTGTGQELHVNRRGFDQWAKVIERHFKIVEAIDIHDNQMLYLTESK